ncbi:MAG: MerC domain-containing protein [Chthonomonadales bacterium]
MESTTSYRTTDPLETLSEPHETGPAAPARLDRIGATASFVCAVHCMIMPLIVTTLPLLGIGFLANDWVEWTLVGISATLGITSLHLGYKVHKSKHALTLLSAGLALIAAGRIGEYHRTHMPNVAMVVLGGLAIATAHLINQKLCHTCRVCNHDRHTH